MFSELNILNFNTWQRDSVALFSIGLLERFLKLCLVNKNSNWPRFRCLCLCVY